jgi:dienelactone hydrolase
MKILMMSLMLLLCGISLSCTDIQGTEIEYTADNVTLKGYLVYDKSIEGKRPAILVVHEWWGHNEYARTRARMLAELGYTALAVDMYGDGKQAQHPEEAGKFAREIMQNMPLQKKRFLAALEVLWQHSSVDTKRIAAIGYCFGGSVVLQIARSGIDLAGVVSFHGGLSTSEPAQPGAVQAKILVCHGSDDEFIPPEQVALFRNEMQKARADFRIINYEGAKHSFTNPDADVYAKKFNIPIGYDADADKKSWAGMREFLTDTLKK